jgi:hypothetical protein
MGLRLPHYRNTHTGQERGHGREVGRFAARRMNTGPPEEIAVTRLVQSLSAGPLDVIGDVHGELGPLQALMTTLGYDRSGLHRDGRRLVFVGDLCDRGPDSPGVIRLVQSLVKAGRAQAVAGNHELNLLRRERKHGNHWFYGLTEDPKHPEFGRCVAIEEYEQVAILAFFGSLPIALERPDLRIVHAAWIESEIATCRAIGKPLDTAYRDFDAHMTSDPEYGRLKALRDVEVAVLGGAFTTESNAAPVAASIGPYEEFEQMGNPIRVLTSGEERVTAQPFFAGGRWRYVERIPWWKNYTGPIPVLFGHYWRWWNPSVQAELSKGEPQLFAEDPVGPVMAADNSAFCIDFSVGAHFKEKFLGHEPPFQGRLAALRWPERELVYDGEDPRVDAA